jgi:hypothetical protein
VEAWRSNNKYTAFASLSKAQAWARQFVETEIVAEHTANLMDQRARVQWPSYYYYVTELKKKNNNLFERN